MISGVRYATADFMLGDEQIKAGETLQVHWAADVDFSRVGNRHIAFASGFHRCLGSTLVRMELRVALETLHRRIPDYALDPARPAGINNVGIRNVDPLPVVFTPR